MTRLLRKISIEEFARRLKVTAETADKRFAFFLGAGCSVSSGIPAAATLVKDNWLPRLRDLRAPSRKDLDAWATETLENYDPQAVAAVYGQVIDQLFFQPEERQREIESLCDGRFPGFGYAVLSGLVTLDAGRFNVVLTTNFDDLVADALYLFTSARPLVIHHESLANFIRPTRTRPLIVKLHGDHRLSPQNTAPETASIKDEIEAHVRTLLHDRGLIFMGYGGNDKGIQEMLETLPTEALPLGVFWVSNSEPIGILRPWLEARNAVWVEKGDFDECMLVLRDEFGIRHPERKRFDEVFEKYTDTYKSLSSRINALPDTVPEASVLKGVVRRTDQSFPDWRAVSLEAQRVEESDPDLAESIFKKGIEQFPQSGRLLADFAGFMRRIRRNQKAAIDLYDRAVMLEDKDWSVLHSIATFLRLHAKDYDRAELFYKKLLDLYPEPFSMTQYANFLAEARKNYDEAEKLYERALATDPNYSFALSSFGVFLYQVRDNPDRAEELLRRAVTIDPSSAYFSTELANFLAYARKDFPQAELYYQRAIEVGPQYSYPLSAFAAFLIDHKDDYDKAVDSYRRAVAVSPYDPHVVVKLASVLSDPKNPHRDLDAAEAQFSKAVSLSPSDSQVLNPYIDFLRNVRQNETRAKELERRLEPLRPQPASG